MYDLENGQALPLLNKDCIDTGVLGGTPAHTGARTFLEGSVPTSAQRKMGRGAISGSSSQKRETLGLLKN